MLIHTLLKSSQQLAYGRFSTVHSAIIPDTLLTSWSLHGETRIALKIIEKRATHFSLWLNEKEILQQLEQFNHPNIVKLLDSYCIDDKYLLLFPLAKGDLADFMLSDPQTSQPMFTWLLQQLRGLTKALEYLHYGNESIKACGRHGDVKPQNILWYGAVDQDESKYGKLVIADLGLSEFRYSTATPSYSKACPCDAVSPSRKRADRQYAPPEIEVAMQMSSASDIWGLGCVFLEIVVWLVDGAESRNSFLRDLHSDSPGQPASYWRMEMTPQRLIFSLKPHISIRLQQLLERTKGDSMLHTFITYLTYSTLLDPNPLTRPTARDIGNRLLEVESGVSMEWGTSTQNLPVWSRHWIHQDHQTSFSCYSPSELEDRLFCTLGTDMVGTDIALHSQKIQDGSLALWQYDDTLEYNWVDELPFKQKCPFCKEVGRPPALKPHIKSQHRDRLFHDCDDCGALFAKKEQLIQHQKGANFQIREGVYVQIPCIFPRNVLATSLKGTVHGLLTKFALTPEVNQPSEEPRHPSQPEPIFCSSNPCICYDSSPNARPRSTCKYGRRVCFDHRASNSHVKKHRSDKGETLSPFLDFKYI
jgi:serine/threonine protein kinase